MRRSSPCAAQCGCCRSARPRPSSSPPAPARARRRRLPARRRRRAGSGRRARRRSVAPSAATVDYTACVAFDTGGLGDKGFNDLAKKGLEDAAALGYKTFFSEAQGATDYAANIQRLIDQGCQSIVTVGFNQAQATIEATKANPDIAFAQVDDVWDETAERPDTPANFTGLDFQIDEAAMLAGLPRRGLQQVGQDRHVRRPAVPGRDPVHGRPVRRHQVSQRARRARRSSCSAGTPRRRQGTFVGGDNPWGDPAKGEQLAQTFLDQGVDIVHPVAGATGNGTHQGHAGRRQVGHRRRHRPGHLAGRVRAARSSPRPRRSSTSPCSRPSRRTPVATPAARTSSARSRTTASASRRSTSSTARSRPS